MPAIARRRALRDALLVLVPCALLAALMAYRGDVVHPRGDDPAHPLGHVASLVHSGHVPGGVFVGALCVLVAVVGVLGLLGDSPLDLRGDEVTTTTPGPRHGAWLVALCALLYLPLAGAYGLWDPWETHYAEVAREVLARDDWITLWWGQEGWFMSKPVLVFWMSALAMDAGSAFGLPFWSGMSPGAHEWFVRVPIALFAIAAVYALYRAVARAFGPRAGLCAGLVLATSPHWFFLAHQGMTDMPFVAPLVCAMACLFAAATTDPEARVTARRVTLFRRALRVSRWHLVVGAVVLVALPQVLYLATRPVAFACGEGDRACVAALSASRVGPVQFPVERFASGSAGNSAYHDAAASTPGSPAWEERYSRVPFATSAVQGLAWLALGCVLLLSLRRERRAQALAFAATYLFGAISFLGKGPAGLGVPEAVLAGFVLVTGRWRLWTRIRLFQGAGIFALCGLPWYVAVACRLGREWFDRFVVNDLLNRAFAGVHGDTGAVGYYVQQLGYGMFPWSALLPVALCGAWMNTRDERERDTARLLLAWFLAAFTLFSLMVTKFHHYIVPAVPPAAALVGIALDRLLDAARERSRSAGTFPRAAGALATACLAGLIARDLAHAGAPVGAARLEQLFTYNYQRAFPGTLPDDHVTLSAFGVAAVLCALAMAHERTRAYAARAFAAVAVCFAAWGLDKYMVDLSAHWSQRGLFERYAALRAPDDAPLAAYRMNWKGENFYTGNSAAMLECGLPLCERVSTAEWIREHRGRRVFFVTERASEPLLDAAVAREHGHTLAASGPRDNAFFVLVEAWL